MKKVALLLGLALAASACGDDDNKHNDASTGTESNPPNPDASPDGGNPNANFTSFVIDLVKNHTNSTEAPVAYTSFSTLDDPDATNNNTSAYNSLFM